MSSRESENNDLDSSSPSSESEGTSGSSEDEEFDAWKDAEAAVAMVHETQIEMTMTFGRSTKADSLHAEEAGEMAHAEGLESEAIDSHGYVEEEGHDYVGRHSYHFGRNLYYITSYDLEPRGPVDEAQLWFIVYHYGGKAEDILVFDADEPAGSWVSYTSMFGETATPETTSLHAHSSSTTNNPMLSDGRHAKVRQGYTDMMGKSESAPRCATSCTVASRILALVVSLAILLGVFLWFYRSIVQTGLATFTINCTLAVFISGVGLTMTSQRAFMMQLLKDFPEKLLPKCCPRSSLRHRHIMTATQGRREKLVLLLCAVILIGAGGMFTGNGDHLHETPLNSRDNDAECILLEDAMENRVHDICSAELLSVNHVSPGSLIQEILTDPIAKADFVKATGFTATRENVFRQTVPVLELFLALFDNYIQVQLNGANTGRAEYLSKMQSCAGFMRMSICTILLKPCDIDFGSTWKNVSSASRASSASCRLTPASFCTADCQRIAAECPRFTRSFTESSSISLETIADHGQTILPRRKDGVLDRTRPTDWGNRLLLTLARNSSELFQGILTDDPKLICEAPAFASDSDVQRCIPAKARTASEECSSKDEADLADEEPEIGPFLSIMLLGGLASFIVVASFILPYALLSETKFKLLTYSVPTLHSKNMEKLERHARAVLLFVTCSIITLATLLLRMQLQFVGSGTCFLTCVEDTDCPRLSQSCKISEAEPVCSAGICSTKCSSDVDCALGGNELSGPYAGVGGWNRNATCSNGGLCKFAPPESILDSCNAFPSFPFAFATGCAAMMAVSSLMALLRGLREVRTRLPPVILTPAYRMWLANPYKEYNRNFGLRSGIYFWRKVLLTALTQNVLQFILLTMSVSRMSISEFIFRAVSIMLGLIILPIITIIRGRMSHPRIVVTVAEIITKLVFFILNSMTRRSIDIIYNDDYRKLQTLATLVPVVSLLRKLYSLSRLLLIRYTYADKKGTIDDSDEGYSQTATRWRTVETLCAHSLILLGFVFGSVSITRVLSADVQCSSVTPLWHRMSPQILHPDGIFANSRCGWEHVKNVRPWEEGDPIISEMLASAEASSGRNVEHPWDKMRVSVLNLSADAQLEVLPEVVMAQQCLRQDAGGEVGLPCTRRASEKEGGEEDAMPTFCKKMNFKDSPTFSERSTNVAKFLASYLSDTLEDLRLQGTDLRTLPKELSSLKHLTLLDIRDNPSLKSVYPALQGLSRLRSENLLADTWRKEHSWNISRAGVTDDRLQRLLTYALPEATKIDLSHNLLESVDSTIREVSISHGKSISRLSLDDNLFIGYYDLGKNGSGISEYLPSLRTLDFNNMRQIQTPQLAENPQFFVDLNRSDLTLSVENVEANTFVFLFYFSSAALRQFLGLSNVGVVLDGVIRSGSSPYPLRYEQSPPVSSGSIYADDFCSGIHFPEKMRKIILYRKPRYIGSDRKGFRKAGCEEIDRPGELFLSELPKCIAQMANLTFLQLQNIQFGSSLNLTTLLGVMSHLTTLILHQMCHSEHLPGDIFLRLRSLKQLEIVDNSISAPLLGFPSELTSLTISNAGFSRIPKVIELTNLLALRVHANRSSFLQQWGSNPQLTKLRKLKSLSLGTLARGTSAPFAFSNELFAMPHLSNLVLSRVVYGTLQPKLIDETVVLRKVRIIGNANLTGNPFHALRHCSSILEDLSVSFNAFSGQIGPEIGQFKYLRQLHLNETKMSGPLPQELSNLAANIRTLQLGGHGLEGKVCHDFLEQFVEIEKLSLQSAHFSGECFLGNHAELSELDLRGSNFSGPFPSLQRSRQLTYMSLSGNAFRGSIPETWASLRKLEHLDLSSLDLSNNDFEIFGNLTDHFDGMRRLNISRNRIDDSAVASSLLANMRGLQSLAIDLHLLQATSKAAGRDAIDAVEELHSLEFLEIFSPAASFVFRRTQLPQETLQIVLCNFVKCKECQEGRNCWV